MLVLASPGAPTAGEPGRQYVMASLIGSGRPLRPCVWRSGANLSPSSGRRPLVRCGAATTAGSIGLRCSAVWHRSPRAITTPLLLLPKPCPTTAFYCRPDASVGTAAGSHNTDGSLFYPIQEPRDYDLQGPMVRRVAVFHCINSISNKASSASMTTSAWKLRYSTCTDARGFWW